MSESENKSLNNLIQEFHHLQKNLYQAISEENDFNANAFGLTYENHIEDICTYTVNSIQEYERKIQFFFEILLAEEVDETLLSECQKSLISDLSKFNLA